MSNLTALIDDFSAGEISPLNEAKVSSDEFKNGLRLCLNMQPDAHGTLIGRPGFEHIDDLPIPLGLQATIHEIRYSKKTFFMAVFWHEKLMVFNQDGTVILDHDTPYTDEDLHGEEQVEKLLKGIVSPNGLTLELTCGTVAPHQIVMTKGDPWAAVFQQTTFESQPAVWGEDNWPTTCAYFQSRTWWGGCEDNPDFFWGSRSFNHYDMATFTFVEGTGNVIYDSDGIELEISKHGRLKWLKGGRNLLIGTEAAEHIVTSEGKAITPSDREVVEQSAYGSSEVDPQLIGNEVMYVTGDGRKLRSMWWKWVESGWVSTDTTFSSEHITEEGVNTMAFARNPSSAIFMGLEDGNLVSCGYRREKQEDPIIGWYRIQNDVLFFLDLAAAERKGNSEVWAVVRGRGVAPGRASLVKYVSQQKMSVKPVCLDCYSTYDGEPTNQPAVTRTFLTETVDCIADGFSIPDVAIVDGKLQLPGEYSVVHYGYRFRQRFKTMPLISPGSDNKAAVGHQSKKWNSVYLKLLKSYYPMVNGKRPQERHVSTPDNTAEPLADTFVRVNPGLGWDREGVLDVEQDLPFQLVVAGIYGGVSIEDIS